MTDFALHFANNSPDGIEIRDSPFPDFMAKYLDIANSTYCEFTSNDQLYKSLAPYISQNCENSNSYKISKKPNVSESTKLLKRFAKLAFAKENAKEEAKTKAKDGKDKDNEKKEGNDSDDEEDLDSTSTSLGLGIYKLKYKDEDIIALHQSIGGPSGRRMNFHKSLVLVIPNKKGMVKVLKDFVTMVLTDKKDDKNKSIMFTVYRWDSNSQYWRYGGRKIGRKLDTIILPKETKDRIMNDMERFVSVESIKWYFEHGIPYKRSYLFYGIPGSGKTSLIQCLACKFAKKLCFLQPTSPQMTDDAFRSCVQQAPADSIIVLEDIDALFEKDRKKKHEQCPLTFSGLLNGLDGVCNPAGQIFILTTNFVDQLDDALIRSGRVDVHVKFPQATDGQIADMFKLFYPNEDEATSQLFVTKMRKCFPEGVSMATTQQHFITNMSATAKEAIDELTELNTRLSAMEKLNEQSKSKAQKKKEKEEKEEKEKKDKDKEEKAKEKEKKKEKEEDKDKDGKKKDAKDEDSKEDSKKKKSKAKTKTKAKAKSKGSKGSKGKSKGKGKETQTKKK